MCPGYPTCTPSLLSLDMSALGVEILPGKMTGSLSSESTLKYRPRTILTGQPDSFDWGDMDVPEVHGISLNSTDDMGWPHDGVGKAVFRRKPLEDVLLSAPDERW